jgi:hypothetical protein
MTEDGKKNGRTMKLVQWIDEDDEDDDDDDLR